MTGSAATRYVLELPELHGDRTLIRAAEGTVQLWQDGGQVALSLGPGWAARLTPAAAREFAGFLVARAEAAAAEPEPADVHALTTTLNEIWKTYDGTAEQMARAILRAGYRPPERAS